MASCENREASPVAFDTTWDLYASASWMARAALPWATGMMPFA
jgi:hypothetical protein